MTFDEIARTACIAILVGVAIGGGFSLAWLTYRTHIEDLQQHVKDLKEAVLILLKNSNGSDS